MRNRSARRTRNSVLPSVQTYRRNVRSQNGFVRPRSLWALNNFVREFYPNYWTPGLYFNPVCPVNATGVGVALWSPGSLIGTVVGATVYTEIAGITGASGRRTETGIIPSSVYSSANNSHMMIYTLTNVTGALTDIGAEDGANGWAIDVRNTTLSYRAMRSSGTLDVTNSTSLGWHLAQAAETALSGYRDTTLLGSATFATGALCTVQLWVGSQNNNGVQSQPSTRRYGMHAFGNFAYNASQINRYFRMAQRFHNQILRA